jgi:hypothetical protein
LAHQDASKDETFSAEVALQLQPRVAMISESEKVWYSNQEQM